VYLIEIKLWRAHIEARRPPSFNPKNRLNAHGPSHWLRNAAWAHAAKILAHSTLLLNGPTQQISGLKEQEMPCPI
jgi:hypothetical protein